MHETRQLILNLLIALYFYRLFLLIMVNAVFLMFRTKLPVKVARYQVSFFLYVTTLLNLFGLTVHASAKLSSFP